MQYNFKQIEKKWQEKWEKSNDFKAADPPTGGSKKEKYFRVESEVRQQIQGGADYGSNLK